MSAAQQTTPRYVIHFPAPAERLSMNGRDHWGKKARITAEWRSAAKVWALNAVSHGLPRPQPPCNVRVVFGVPDPGRRRDPHNLAPTVKAIIDGLVDARLFPDDTAEWVTVIDPAFIKGDGVRVELEAR